MSLGAYNFSTLPLIRYTGGAGEDGGVVVG